MPSVEGLIGVVARVFDPAFEVLTQLAYTRILSVSDSSLTVNAFKGGLSTRVILPQSVLLGMTFPLMSSGILRAYPDPPGGTIATLYFTNGVGAAISVLVSGFVLIAWSGRPGTMFTAGLINIVLALLVWLCAKNLVEVQLHSMSLPSARGIAVPRYGLMRLVA